MKFVKRISYFFVIPVVFLILGIFLGVWGIHFFYPGQWQDLNENRLALPLTEEETAADTDPYEAAPSVEAAASGETLCADTEYVLEEADIVRGTTVETSWKIPHKYIGMNRENFLETMELYAAHPPLSEIERGFVGLEVLSFSREKVMVRMDYRYVQPSASFYLAVSDNEGTFRAIAQKGIQATITPHPVDRTRLITIADFVSGALGEKLPEQIQLQIMDMLFVPDEETLYDFLETYSS